MKKYVFLSVFLLTAGGCLTYKTSFSDYTVYVDPLNGVVPDGPFYRGACYPAGLVHPGPEAANENSSSCAGNESLEKNICGFSQIRLNNTGCSGSGAIFLQPFSGSVLHDDYCSGYSEYTQKAEPGYYAVTLDDFDVNVEITASEHVAFHRYTFNGTGPLRMLVDLQHGIADGTGGYGKHTPGFDVTVEDKYTITGHNEAQQWLRRHYYYVIRFDRPYSIIKELPGRKQNKAPRYVLDFNLFEGEQLQVKVALSTVSVDSARVNMNKEVKKWNFDKVCASARSAWNEYLSRIDAIGSADQQEQFYTCMYRLFMYPANIADVDGRYRSSDGRVMQAESGRFFSSLFLRNTSYRTAYFLYAILSPEIDLMSGRDSRGFRRTQEIDLRLFDCRYPGKPDGAGSENGCAQMPARFIFSAMGFYPLNSYDDGYMTGSPQMEKIVLNLPHGKTFTVEVKNFSPGNRYVHTVTLNGEILDGFRISHEDIMNGGRLVFRMGAEPLK
ncbi:MAG: glycoside hydrolase family 92 protein [Kiritimatiellia bacterium]